VGIRERSTGRGQKLLKGRNPMIALLKRLHKEESGQDLIEYALLAGLIAVACVATINPIAAAINAKFTAIATALQ
jgi:pilus assembly protein Flp/PilA